MRLWSLHLNKDPQTSVCCLMLSSVACLQQPFCSLD